MHLNVFEGLSCAFILTFFDLACSISVYRISSIRAHSLISARPRISAHPVDHNIKQAPRSNKRSLLLLITWGHYYKPSCKHNSGLHELWSHHLLQCARYSRYPPKGGGGYFQKPLPYFRPKCVIFPTLFQTWSTIWYPISDLPYNQFPRSEQC